MLEFAVLEDLGVEGLLNHPEHFLLLELRIDLFVARLLRFARSRFHLACLETVSLGRLGLHTLSHLVSSCLLDHGLALGDLAV